MAHYEWQTTRSGRRFVRIADAPAPNAARAVARPVPLVAANLHPDRTALTKAELVVQAEIAGVDTSGNKPDILARLESSDG